MSSLTIWNSYIDFRFDQFQKNGLNYYYVIIIRERNEFFEVCIPIVFIPFTVHFLAD